MRISRTFHTIFFEQLIDCTALYCIVKIYLNETVVLLSGRVANARVQLALGAVDVDGKRAQLVHFESFSSQCVHGKLLGVAYFGRYVGCKRRLGYVFVVEFDRDLVLARLRANVGDAARAVLVVLKVDLGLGRALDGNGQCAGACFARVYVKVGRRVYLAFNEA